MPALSRVYAGKIPALEVRRSLNAGLRGEFERKLASALVAGIRARRRAGLGQTRADFSTGARRAAGGRERGRGLSEPLEGLRRRAGEGLRETQHPGRVSDKLLQWHNERL